MSRGHKLGEGSFGCVYQGMYQGKSNGKGSRKKGLPPQMAIKVVRVEDQRLQDKLQAECELLRTFKHENIIEYFGCVKDEEKKEASIFMELMPHSLLTAYKNFGPMNEKVIRRYTIQILRALKYLHEHEKGIIHGDVKAANILYDGSLIKLTDFGESRVLKVNNQQLGKSFT